MKMKILFAMIVAIIMSGCMSTGSRKKNGTIDSSIITITDKNWKLIELKGKILTPVETWVKEPFLFLNEKELKVTGNGGCNSFFGSYRLLAGNKISFLEMGSTKMACPDMDTESQFLQVLSETDNYALSGDTLVFYKGQTGPLAKLVIINYK